MVCAGLLGERRFHLVRSHQVVFCDIWSLVLELLEGDAHVLRVFVLAYQAGDGVAELAWGYVVTQVYGVTVFDGDPVGRIAGLFWFWFGGSRCEFCDAP